MRFGNSERFRHLLPPTRVTNRATPLDARTNHGELRSRLRHIYHFEPIRRARDRPFREGKAVLNDIAMPDAAPRPVRGALDQAGSHRIPLDISRDAQKMLL